MWVTWTLVVLAVLLWFGVSWLSALVEKYSHSLESISVLAILGVASLWFGRQAVGKLAPEWTMGPTLGASLVIGLVVFSLLSYVVVNLWLALLTKEYDQRIASLEEEEDSILRTLESMRWQSLRAGASEGPMIKETPKVSPKQNEADVLADFVARWEQEGGAARIRSLKVLEWKDEVSAKSEDDLRQFISQLRQVTETETDDIRKEQARVRLALAELEALSRTPARRDSEESWVSKDVRDQSPAPIDLDQSALRQRLQEINRCINVARSEKALFLRHKVSLRWGRRQ
ncbi:MAG: hypothetical protein ACOX3V_06105 [Bacillota bacterium]|jgi:hypothetical protein